MGISPALWDQMRTPKAGSGGELSENTQTYIDVHIALECLHVTYSQYIQMTSRNERELLQLYLGLKALKEEQAIKTQQAQAEMERTMARGMNGARA